MHSNVAVSVAVNAKVAEALVVDEPSAGPEVIVVSGGVVSAVLPAPSSRTIASISNESPFEPVEYAYSSSDVPPFVVYETGGNFCHELVEVTHCLADPSWLLESHSRM